jgi:hypothetical protein
MTGRITPFILLAFSFFLNSCIDCVNGEGSPVDEERATNAFESFHLDCSADVVIHQIGLEDHAHVVVHAQENLLPFIITHVEGDKLVIDIEGCINATEEIEIEVFAPPLSKISNDGSGDINSSETLHSEELEISNDGSGDIEVDFNGSELSIDNDGSGDFEIAGVVDNLEIRNDGSGDIDTKDLEANEVEVVSHGSGSISVHVKDDLDIKLSGSGDVSYEGDPQNIKQQNTGSGEVKHLD